MRIVIAAVGKPRGAAVAAAIHEYESRAARYWPLEVREVREEPARSSTAGLVRDREASRLQAALPPAAQVVACDPTGTGLSSEEFSAWLQRERELARDVAFLIGGAYGLAPSLQALATRRLLLAPWTLPHEIARLVLAEQLYRAGTIVRGEPYHK